MTRLFRIILVGCVLCLTTRCQPATQTASEVLPDVEADGEAIRSFVRNWTEATNAADVDRLMSMVTDDCVRIPPNAPPIIGKDAIRADIEREFDTYTEVGDEAVVDFRVAGDFAFSRGTFNYVATAKVSGEVIQFRGHFIDVYQRQPDGSWKLFWNAWNDSD